jgi:His/Glu/Gln/Arg/opine family amino acid ABC transporter permease subunit
MSKIINFFKELYDSFYMSVIYDNRYEYILEGLGNTLLISLFAVIIGIIIGVVIALIRTNYEKNGKMKLANSLAKFYVNVVRGTPVILQLMIIYYVIFETVDINIVLVGIIAFGINSGAYVSEIIRAGINSVPDGQMEAGYALGLKYGQVMRYIVLPQALKNILPALGNEFITLIKETSVGAYIGIVELTKASDIIASRTYDYFFPLFIIAIIYLILTLGLTKVVNMMEVKLNNARS